MSIIITSKYKKNFILINIGIAISFYILEGILLNPLILWTTLPIYFVLLHFNFSYNQQSKKKLYGVYGFLIASIGFTYFYHLLWFFNHEGIVTSSSTSSLIFVVFPLYAIILGYIGYFIGILIFFTSSTSSDE